LTGDKKFPKDEVHELIAQGRKRGYLLFEEVDKSFQNEPDSEGNFNEFLSSLDNYGIKILDKRRKTQPKKRKSDIVSLEGLERTTDPVKLYLREMGNISLLTREGEIAIAREIERGEKSVIKALSKTRIVLNTILSLEEKIDEDEDILQSMFESSDDDLSEGKIEERKKQIINKIQEIRELGHQLDKIPPRKKNNIARGRYIVQISRLIRDFNIRLSHREQIIESLRDKY
jgi:RNA polymerase primary sigma factor